MYDVNKIRKDFPILSRQVYGRPLVYLDNAATTQKPLCVLDAMRDEYLNVNANVHRGVHYLSQQATDLHEAARERVRRFINARATEEVVFTRGTTEAINLVASTFCESQMQAGDEVIVTDMEHHSNIVPWQLQAQRRGIVVRHLPITDDGQLDLSTLTSHLIPEQSSPTRSLSPLTSKLEHLGWPLNSQGDDFGMTFEGKRNQGYFCSSRGDLRGNDHIYSFYNPEIVQTVKGWVYEQDGYELPAAQVYMVGNDGTNLRLSVRGDGSFTQEVKPGVDYVLLATCKGYLNHQQELRVESSKASEEHVLQFPLANISAPVLIENIFYDFNKATLRPESATALDELVRTLNENPNVTIELSAHTDCRGSDEYNEKLSQRRAESVVNYLIQHGIAADRLTPKGYGEGRPKHIKRKVAEKYLFLKEGDVLNEEFISTLPEEQQEQCHQLNRRTEFTVLRTTYGLFDKAGKLIRKPAPAQPPRD